jgi:uncharacterized protein (DUF697 family)
MAKTSELMNTWNTIKEVDLRPLRQQALNGIRVAIVGMPGSGRTTLANQMRSDPTRPQNDSDAPVLVLDLENAAQAGTADLIILTIDSRRSDTNPEQALARLWTDAGKRVLVFINEFEEPQGSVSVVTWSNWSRRRIVHGSALNDGFLVSKFAPAVIDLVPNQLLGLARTLPLFRIPVAHYLINETCLSNAAYSLSTGLAEVVPIFDVPLNVTDMIVLTKTQAYLVYKLGLAFGFSTQWQDYVAEFGSVLGSGFLWRQLARSLIGLIPVYGIVPKVGVAYAGTYVVGNAILQWYLTGRHISAKQMRELYVQAFTRGKETAHQLMARVPRPSLPKGSRPKLPKISRPRLPGRKSKAALPAPQSGQTCQVCNKTSAADAAFCQYCGNPFAPAPAAEDTPMVEKNSAVE